MNPDFRDLLAAFNAEGVEYLIVGAHAMAAHGHVRATEDLDVWVHATPENAPRVLDALRSFGAPLQDLTETDLMKEGLVFQIGLAPIRIDVLTDVDGLDFVQAWADRVQTKFAGLPTAVLSREHIILNKKATGRTQDLADIERLESSEGFVE